MKNKLKYLPYIGVTISLLIPYYQTIMSLALFGDATMHAHRTKLLLEQGLFAVNFKFPHLYNFIQAGLFLLMGEKGLNFIVFIGVVLIVVAIYLLVEVITSNKLTGFIAVLLVLSSPKLMYYSSRMYMEILLSGFVVLSIWALVRYFKSSNLKNVILLSLLVSISALIKQQGLFILFPSVLGTLLIYAVVEKIQSRATIFKHILVFILINIFLMCSGYYFVFRSSGEIIPGSKEYLLIRVVNEIGRKVSGFREPEELHLESELESSLKEKWKEMTPKASTLAEKRHIKPTDPLTSWEDFIKTNSMYVPNLGSRHISKSFANTMSLMLIFCFFIYLRRIIGKNIDLSQKMFFVFICIFIINNYVLFAKNTDQMRYHLFLPIILTAFSSYGAKFFIDLIPKNKFKSATYALLFVLVFLKAGMLLSTSAVHNSNWNKTQIYKPSIGGTASIIEAGEWLNDAETEDSYIWHSCGNELRYYSRKQFIGDFFAYFASEDELREYLDQMHVSYVVIYDSQVVPDTDWRNYCWLPESFAKLVGDIYPAVFVSTQNDIYIYKVE